MKAEEMKGPTALPRPIHEPRIPMNLPLLSSVVTSDTTITVKAMMPLVPTPLIPLNRECGPVSANEKSRPPSPSRHRHDII